MTGLFPPVEVLSRNRGEPLAEGKTRPTLLTKALFAKLAETLGHFFSTIASPIGRKNKLTGQQGVNETRDADRALLAAINHRRDVGVRVPQGCLPCFEGWPVSRALIAASITSAIASLIRPRLSPKAFANPEQTFT